MNKLLYITFYTEGHYQKIAEENIISSFEKFKLDHIAYSRPNLKDWVLNTRQKIDVIETALLDHPDHDIVYIDADATIESEPILFNSIPDEVDIGLHYLDWHKHYGRNTDKGQKELLSGTIYLRNSPKITNLVRKWKELTVNYNWEQRALETLIEAEMINVWELPWEYCYIATRPNGESPAYPLENPVIVHYQESRVVKKNKELLK